jgi:hypothetical protein
MENQLATIINDLSNASDPSVRYSSLTKLWSLTDHYKLEICLSEFDVLMHLSRGLRDWSDDISSIRIICCCLWFLSRDTEASPHLCYPKYEFVALCMKYLLDNHTLGDNANNITTAIVNCFSNCLLNKKNHQYLLNDEVDFIHYTYQTIFSAPTESDSYQTICCTALPLEPQYRHYLLKYPFHIEMYNNLYRQGTNISDWTSRSGIDYWSLNYLMTISSWKEAQETMIKDLPNLLPYFG